MRSHSATRHQNDNPHPSPARRSTAVRLRWIPLLALGATAASSLLVWCGDTTSRNEMTSGDITSVESVTTLHGGGTPAPERSGAESDTGTQAVSPAGANPGVTDGSTTDGGTSGRNPGAPSDQGSALAAVTDLLRRYDQLVTALAADPNSTASPSHPARRAWDQLVPTGTLLHDDVIESLVTERVSDGTRLVPGPEGVGYRHHVGTVSITGNGSIDFTWCGYSPGVRVDTMSGAVLDDGVARMTGIGRASLRDGSTTEDPNPAQNWVLVEFAHLELQVMQPRSADPCV